MNTTAVSSVMVWALWFAALSQPSPAAGQAISDSTLAALTFEQRLGTQVALDLAFRDDTGAPVQLWDYAGTKPTILVLGYYECPMLCTLVLNGLVEALEDMKWSAGKEFQVIFVSINPRETPALAAAKKRMYLKRYGRADSTNGWHFLTGSEYSIRRLADQVGFQYAYDERSKQYAHPSGLVMLTPNGKVAGYLFGVTFSATQLFQTLQGAGSSRIHSPIQKVILLCFHYNPIRGKYGTAIMLIVRGLAVATLLGLAYLILSNLSREKPRQVFAVPLKVGQKSP